MYQYIRSFVNIDILFLVLRYFKLFLNFILFYYKINSNCYCKISICNDTQNFYNYVILFLQGYFRFVLVFFRLYSFLIGQQLDFNKNVTVFVGAYGVLFCVVQGLINFGDEVVIIELFFDCYESMVKVVGGIVYYCFFRFVNMYIENLI